MRGYLLIARSQPCFLPASPNIERMVFPDPQFLTPLIFRWDIVDPSGLLSRSQETGHASAHPITRASQTPAGGMGGRTALSRITVSLVAETNGGSRARRPGSEKLCMQNVAHGGRGVHGRAGLGVYDPERPQNTPAKAPIEQKMPAHFRFCLSPSLTNFGPRHRWGG